MGEWLKEHSDKVGVRRCMDIWLAGGLKETCASPLQWNIFRRLAKSFDTEKNGSSLTSHCSTSPGALVATNVDI